VTKIKLKRKKQNRGCVVAMGAKGEKQKYTTASGG
jgi:hypothetical protein